MKQAMYESSLHTTQDKTLNLVTLTNIFCSAEQSIIMYVFEIKSA